MYTAVPSHYVLLALVVVAVMVAEVTGIKTTGENKLYARENGEFKWKGMAK